MIADAETKMITYSNAAQCRIFGYTEEQFRTMSIADIHPQETFGYALAEFESMLRKQKGLAENIECRKKNGEIFLADISATLITLNGKNQLLGFFRDITTRKKAEAALRQSEEQRESILNSVIDVVWSLSWPDMKINFISPSVAQLFGRPLEECMTNPALWTDAVHPDDKDVSEKAFEQLKKEGSAVRECRIVRPDGSIVWINDKSKIITDNEGKPIRIDGVSIDITERKIAEQKISDLNKNLELTVVQRTEQFKEALSRLEKIADRVPGVVYQYRLNPDGSSCFPYASEGIRDIYGVSPEEVAHDALAVFTRLHPDDFDGVVASIRESGKNISLWQHEYRVKFSDGTVNWLSGNAMPQTEEDGTILRHGHISDITWRKKEEEALIDAKNEAEKANLAKSEFLSRMSHELRTPMNSILGFAQLMEMGELSKKQKKGITHILNNGRHLLDLINEVLDISGIEAGRQMLNPEPVQLTGIINEITEGMQVAANKRKVSVEFVDSPTNSLFVIADRLRLKQILINLLNNAVKYNVEEGSVTITTALKPAGEQENKLIRISITDTGVGIKPENIGKLFQPFERIGADKTETEGTGLGLMMVKRLAEAMGGTVGVESVSGAGSNFWIELPLSENQNKDTLTANDEVNKQLQVIKHEATILYIEDNISNIELVEDILMVHHPKMRLVTSMYGKQTIELALQYNPGLILLDLDLPDMNGMEVLEKLLAYPLTKSIPVIIISADAMPFQVEKLKKAGAGEYLTKPLDVVEFLKTIDLYIKK
jgi:PAS domain S-box-containing protein